MRAPERYGRVREGHAQRLALATERLRQAAQAHPERVVLATSLGAEDMVLTDLIARHRLGIKLATLDTGRLHASTLEMLPRIEARYGLKVRVYSPPAQAVIHFVRERGLDVMRESLAGRQACCALRKLEPLQRLLDGHTAWVVGLRRGQSSNRAEQPFETVDETGRCKLAPLADWSQADVWHYIGEHQVPYNPLHDAFHPSIGCEPCTRAVALGEDERAGRWWWEHASAQECGLHPVAGAHQQDTEVHAA
jgi:phosphoadenosine phosphosulfate reductase